MAKKELMTEENIRTMQRKIRDWFPPMPSGSIGPKALGQNKQVQELITTLKATYDVPDSTVNYMVGGSMVGPQLQDISGLSPVSSDPLGGDPLFPENVPTSEESNEFFIGGQPNLPSLFGQELRQAPGERPPEMSPTQETILGFGQGLVRGATAVDLGLVKDPKFTPNILPGQQIVSDIRAGRIGGPPINPGDALGEMIGTAIGAPARLFTGGLRIVQRTATSPTVKRAATQVFNKMANSAFWRELTQSGVAGIAETAGQVIRGEKVDPGRIAEIALFSAATGTILNRGGPPIHPGDPLDPLRERTPGRFARTAKRSFSGKRERPGDFSRRVDPVEEIQTYREPGAPPLRLPQHATTGKSTPKLPPSRVGMGKIFGGEKIPVTGGVNYEDFPQPERLLPAGKQTEVKFDKILQGGEEILEKDEKTRVNTIITHIGRLIDDAQKIPKLTAGSRRRAGVPRESHTDFPSDLRTSEEKYILQQAKRRVEEKPLTAAQQKRSDAARKALDEAKLKESRKAIEGIYEKMEAAQLPLLTEGKVQTYFGVKTAPVSAVQEFRTAGGKKIRQTTSGVQPLVPQATHSDLGKSRKFWEQLLEGTPAEKARAITKAAKGTPQAAFEKGVKTTRHASKVATIVADFQSSGSLKAFRQGKSRKELKQMALDLGVPKTRVDLVSTKKGYAKMIEKQIKEGRLTSTMNVSAGRGLETEFESIPPTGGRRKAGTRRTTPGALGGQTPAPKTPRPGKHLKEVPKPKGRKK